MRVELHPDAEEEIFQGAAWYEDRQPGLGDAFFDEIMCWAEAIAEAPLTWPRWPGAPDLPSPIRRVVVDRFPYCIAYQAFPILFAHGRWCAEWVCRSTSCRALARSSRRRSTRSTPSPERPSSGGFESMSVPRRVAAFLDLAAEDVAAARTLAATKNRYAAYHCQQAAEKLIKAVLLHRGLAGASIEMSSDDTNRVAHGALALERFRDDMFFVFYGSRVAGRLP